ncbi:MAG: RNHCP domain-containing protein [Clostridiales bacterium]
MEKRFTMIDDGFECENCNKSCNPLKYTARNHCPFCLFSKHVDVNPGDRLENCHGMLIPIGIEKFKKTYKIIYRCEKCKKIRKNIMAKDDNFELIIKLSSNIY